MLQTRLRVCVLGIFALLRRYSFFLYHKNEREFAGPIGLRALELEPQIHHYIGIGSEWVSSTTKARNANRI